MLNKISYDVIGGICCSERKSKLEKILKKSSILSTPATVANSKIVLFDNLE
jgi:hypothetical protein